MPYLFTSESVSEGHPDKVADQISDALIDHFLAFDASSKVACETLVTTGQVVLAGEVKSKAYLDVQQIARDVIERIGYTKSEYMFEAHSCGVLSAIHEQSPDINQGVERKKPEEQGAGDQGMMFGYACRDTDNYMPLPLEISHMLLRELAVIRREANSKMPYLRPDAKSQVTIEYNDDNTPRRIDAIVVSTQHDDFVKPKDGTKAAKQAGEGLVAKFIETTCLQHVGLNEYSIDCEGFIALRRSHFGLRSAMYHAPKSLSNDSSSLVNIAATEAHGFAGLRTIATVEFSAFLSNRTVGGQTS